MSKKRKTKEKHKNLLYYIVIAVILTCAVIAVSELPLPFYIGGEGLTVSSITADRTISNNEDIASSDFIVDTKFSGKGGAIWGTTVGTPFRDKSGNVIPTQYDLKITADSVNEYAYYHILNEGSLLRKYHQTGYHWKPETAPANKVLTYESLTRVNYIYYTEEGNKGVFNAVSTRFDTTIKAEAGGESASGTISTASTSCNLKTPSGRYIGDAVWTGSLVTGEGLDDPSFYAIISPSGSTRWKVILRSQWEEYDDTEDQIYGILLGWKERGSLLPSEYNIQEKLDILNKKADSTLDLPEQRIMGIGQTQDQVKIEEDGGEYKHVFKVRLGDNNIKWSNPSVLFYIKASWVGAYVPVGQPKIVSVSFAEVSSGETKTLDVQVRNDASVRATFVGVIVEPCLIKQERFSIQITLNPGQTGTLSIPISTGTANVDETGRCRVEVYDATKRTNNDFAYFDYHAKKAKQCTVPGQWVDAGEDCFKRCSEDGYWERPICCKSDEKLEYDAADTTHGGWVCVKKDDKPPTPEDCLKACRKYYGCSVLSPLDSCNLRCEIECWIKAHMLWFAAGIGVIFLYFITRARRQVSPIIIHGGGGGH